MSFLNLELIADIERAFESFSQAGYRLTEFRYVPESFGNIYVGGVHGHSIFRATLDRGEWFVEFSPAADGRTWIFDSVLVRAIGDDLPLAAVSTLERIQARLEYLAERLSAIESLLEPAAFAENGPRFKALFAELSSTRKTS